MNWCWSTQKAPLTPKIHLKQVYFKNYYCTTKNTQKKNKWCHKKTMFKKHPHPTLQHQTKHRDQPTSSHQLINHWGTAPRWSVKALLVAKSWRKPKVFRCFKPRGCFSASGGERRFSRGGGNFSSFTFLSRPETVKSCGGLRWYWIQPKKKWVISPFVNSPIFKCSWTKSCTRWYWKYLGIKVWKHSSSQVSLPGWVVHQQYHSVPQRLLGASGHQGNSLKCSDIQPRRKTESEENLPKICIYIYNYNWHKYLLLYIYIIFIYLFLYSFISVCITDVYLLQICVISGMFIQPGHWNHQELWSWWRQSADAKEELAAVSWVL